MYLGGGLQIQTLSQTRTRNELYFVTILGHKIRLRRGKSHNVNGTIHF
jgi:hypothetical protein